MYLSSRKRGKKSIHLGSRGEPRGSSWTQCPAVNLLCCDSFSLLAPLSLVLFDWNIFFCFVLSFGLLVFCFRWEVTSFIYSFYFWVEALGLEPRTLCLLSTRSAPELRPSPELCPPPEMSSHVCGVASSHLFSLLELFCHQDTTPKRWFKEKNLCWSSRADSVQRTSGPVNGPIFCPSF